MLFVTYCTLILCCLLNTGDSDMFKSNTNMADYNIVSPQQPPVQPHVTAVAIKLLPSHPQVWFAQVKARFVISGINNQQTMFDYIIASLLPEVATVVCHPILTPLEDNQYNALMAQLTAVTKQPDFQQLLGSEELGDCKPSQFLQHFAIASRQQLFLQ